MKKPTLYTHCGLPLGSARIVVNDPQGVSGTFHLGGCYQKAVEASRSDAEAVQARALHSDVETVCGE